MARATTKAITRSAAVAAAPKKKIGRPLGSKNRVPASAKANTVAARRTPPAAPAVRMNKAELEAHVVKLERSLARARAQTAELKRALKETPQPTTTAKSKASPAATKAASKSGTAPARRGRRSKAEIAMAEQAQETEADQSAE